MADRRVVAFTAILLGCLVLGGVWVLVASQNAESTTSDARVGVAGGGHLDLSGAVLARAIDKGDARLNGAVERAALGSRPGAAAAKRAGRLNCVRVHMAAGRGICLSLAHSGVDYRVKTFDEHFHVVSDAGLDGLPSRARVSPGGRYGATTTFVNGHSYTAPGGFSTHTQLLDMRTGRSVANLEQFAVTREGRELDSPDINFWGVTFARDENRFYVTVMTGGKRYLAEGSIRDRSVRILRENVECPSLSPDGTRVAYKKRVGAPDDWRLHVLDLRTMRDTPLAEKRSIDDQAEWLEDDVVGYGDGEDVWAVRADGRGAPSRLLRRAASPVSLR